MYCNKCGKQIIDNSVFCNFCGEKIEIIDSVENNNKLNGKPLDNNDEKISDSKKVQDNSSTESKKEDYIYINIPQGNIPKKPYKKPISIVLVVL